MWKILSPERNLPELHKSTIVICPFLFSITPTAQQGKASSRSAHTLYLGLQHQSLRPPQSVRESLTASLSLTANLGLPNQKCLQVKSEKPINGDNDAYLLYKALGDSPGEKSVRGRYLLHPSSFLYGGSMYSPTLGPKSCCSYSLYRLYKQVHTAWIKTYGSHICPTC